MKHFYDTEFLEDGRTIELISIGIVSEKGAEYYAINSDIQTDEALHRRISQHDFLARHVIKHLPLENDRSVATQLEHAGEFDPQNPYFRAALKNRDRATAGYLDGRARELVWDLDMEDSDVKPKWVIGKEVRKFFLDQGDIDEIELWANYGAYDHVVLMQLWGPMIARPDFLPMYTHDLQHYAHDLGVSWQDLPKQEAAVHDALADARHDWDIWKFLDYRRVRQLMAAD